MSGIHLGRYQSRARVGRRGLLLSTAVAVAGLSSPAAAQDFTIVNGQVVNVTQTMANPGDTGLIEPFGTISVGAADAVEMQAADQTLTNQGTLEAGNLGISFTGDNARIDNSGTIDAALGVSGSGNNPWITNSGWIDADNAGVNVATGSGARIENSGWIATAGGPGLSSGSANAWIENRGSVNSAVSQGIFSAGHGSWIGNSGGITAADFGINSVGEGDRVSNSGWITSTSTTGVLLQGDNHWMENTGRIDAAAIGIDSNGDNGWIKSSGSIEAGTFGIDSAGDFAWIKSSGSINASIGIQSIGADAWIANSGEIDAPSGGIWSFGTMPRIRNDGSIASPGGNAIFTVEADAWIVNTGSVEGAIGILGSGANTSIYNSGTASALGAAINTNGSGALIVNSGVVATTGGGSSTALLVGGSDSTVISSGTVLGDTGNAIVFNQGDATLSLLASSVIDGVVEFRGTGNTLTIGPGLNTFLEITDNFAETILTDSPHIVYDGDTVVAIDPSRFAIADELITDLTGAIADTVDKRLAAARRCHAGGGGADLPEGYAEAFGFADRDGCGHDQAVWATALGGYRDQDASDTVIGFDHWFAGLMAGADRAVSATTLAGLYGGYAYGEVELDGNAQDTETNSAFAGAYWSHAPGPYFVDLGLLGGVTWFDEERHVANNTVAGGLETAESDTHGIFVSPTATIGTDMAMGNTVLTPSARFRYAFLHIDGYDESGSMADLDVDSRNVHVVELRGQLALSRDVERDNGIWTAAMRGGVDGIFNWGNDVDVALLGQSLTFAAGDEDAVARGFVGADVAFAGDGGTAFGAGVEVGYDTAEALTAEALVNLSKGF